MFVCVCVCVCVCHIILIIFFVARCRYAVSASCSTSGTSLPGSCHTCTSWAALLPPRKGAACTSFSFVVTRVVWCA